MAVKFGDVQFIGPISDNAIGETDHFYLFNVSIKRVVCTGYMACLNDGYTYTIYDGQLILQDGIFYYLSDWKYANLKTESELQQAKWVKSSPYVLETSPNESYPMTKSLVQMLISEKSGVKIYIHKENEIAVLENTNATEYGEILKKHKDEICEAATAMLNHLLSGSKVQIDIVY